MGDYEPNPAYEDWKASTAGKKYDAVVGQRLISESEPFILFSPEWAKKFEEKIPRSEIYPQLSKGWKGSVVLKILSQPEIGFENDLYLFMDLHDVECKSIRLVPKEVGKSALYKIVGGYEQWKLVMMGDLDVMGGIMEGELDLEDKLKLMATGKFYNLIRRAAAAKELVNIAAQVGCKYPDELDPEKLEGLKTLFKKLQEVGI